MDAPQLAQDGADAAIETTKADGTWGRAGTILDRVTDAPAIDSSLPRAWRRWPLFVVLGVLALIVLAAAGLWLQRKPIAADAIAREMDRRGVQATYRVTRIGLRTQRLEDIVIGDPRAPDLTAAWAEVVITPQWPTPWKDVTVDRITARGVRLNGRIVDGKLRLGQIDRLLLPPSGKPFAFPDFAVDIDDTRIRLDTAAGVIGLALRGQGKLSDGFRGRLAASIPRFAPGAGCVGTGVRASVALAIDRRSPHVAGPVSARSVDCAASDVRVTRPQVVVDARLPEALNRWQGSARVGLARLEVARGAADGVGGGVRFAGDADVTLGTLDMLARQARFAGHAGQRLRFDGRYRVQPRVGRVALLGDAALSRLALDPTLRTALTTPLLAAANTPLAPLGRAASAAMLRATGAMDVAGRLALVHGPGGGGARLQTADVRAGSGARLAIGGGEGLSYYWPDGLLHIDGEASLAGGGLPTARLAFDQPRPGGLLSGILRVAPYQADDARLALAPVRFASLGGGRTRIDTVVTLDGSFRDGRVEGLVVPVSGAVGPNGRYAFNTACTPARWNALRYAGLSLGPTAVSLCPTAGALVSGAGGGLRGGATLADPRFAGRFNGRPFRASATRAVIDADSLNVAAQGVRLDWGAIQATAVRVDAPIRDRRFTARDVGIGIGQEPSRTRIAIPALDGGWQGSDFAGTFARASGRVGQVPLLMSDAAGTWSYSDNVLGVGGGLTVADAAPDPRFFPLVTRDARFTLADNRVAATATLRDPESGTQVTDIKIAHDLRDGTGDAVLDVPGIRFGPTFQPEALTRLTTGVVALVDGIVRGRGTVAWSPRGVTSGGRFRTDDLDLAAAFGPVTGIKGEIVFSDLLGLTTAPGQFVTIDEINPGILVTGGRLDYQLLPGQRVRIEEGRWPYAGGELILEETILDLGRPAPKRLTFRVVGMDAALFVQQFEFENIAATGIFDGVIPMVFDERGGRIVGGVLTSREGGGTLAYVGVLSDQALGTYGKLAFDALKRLRYSSMGVYLDGDLDGEFLSRFTIDGRNQPEKATGILKQITGLPFKFNIAIRGQFRALLATARSFSDPRDLIKRSQPLPVDNLPGTAPGVQPQASETRP